MRYSASPLKMAMVSNLSAFYQKIQTTLVQLKVKETNILMGDFSG
jgi:hypothetical protein